jgi:hypothetical protein
MVRSGFAPAAAALLAEQPDLGGVWADTWSFGLERGRRVVPPSDLTKLLTGNYLDTFAVVRRSALEEVGGWDERAVVNEDWDLWLALAGSGWQLGRIDLIGGDHRKRPGSGSTPLSDPAVRIDMAVAMAEKHHSLYESRIGGVVRNYMTALLRAETANRVPTMVPTTSGTAPSEDARRVRELTDELAASRAEVRQRRGVRRRGGRRPRRGAGPRRVPSWHRGGARRSGRGGACRPAGDPHVSVVGQYAAMLCPLPASRARRAATALRGPGQGAPRRADLAPEAFVAVDPRLF